MNNPADLTVLDKAVRSGDVEAVRAIVTAQVDILRREGYGRHLLRLAARKDNVALVAMFVEAGVDINTPDSEVTPEGPIEVAASEGSARVVRWMLDHGAQINFWVQGVLRSFPLTNAVLGNHIEVVKMLVEAGAAINAAWAGNNALSFSRAYGRKEIEQYLLSRGAVGPGEADQIDEEPVNPLVEHIEAHFGKVEPLSIGPIVPEQDRVLIRIAQAHDAVILFTDGMADRSQLLPPDGPLIEPMELLLFLPPDWKISPENLGDRDVAWPVAVLRQMSLASGAELEVLDDSTLSFAKGQPPVPLGPNAEFSCAVARRDLGESGQFDCADGRRVYLYKLVLLFSEELDLCRQAGAGAIQRLFEELAVTHTLDSKRRNLAIPG